MRSICIALPAVWIWAKQRNEITIVISASASVMAPDNAKKHPAVIMMTENRRREISSRVI